MHIIPIYDKQGTEVNRLEIDDDLNHCGGRVWKGKEHYYKGLGIPYSHHQLLEKDITDDFLKHLALPVIVFSLTLQAPIKSGKKG